MNVIFLHSPFISDQEGLVIFLLVISGYLTPNLIPYCLMSLITAAYLLRTLWYFVDLSCSYLIH